MKALSLVLALLPLVTPVNAHAAKMCEAGMPRYRPALIAPPKDKPYLTDDGSIRIVGYNDMTGMIGRWNAAYAAGHPGFRFDVDLPSTRSAPPALTAGGSALAPMGAPFTAEDLKKYMGAIGRSPAAVAVAHDSLSSVALSGPLAIVVSRNNPLRSITVDQIRQVFAAKTPPTWNVLGIDGVLNRRPIRALGINRGTALALFMEAHALGGLPLTPTLEGFGHSTDVIARIKDDPEAIGFAAANTADAGVRVLPIRRRPNSPAIAPTRAALRAGRYPLDRQLLIYVRAPMEPWVRDYLRLVLSCEGQQIVDDDPLHYIPLSPREVRSQRRHLS